MASEQGDVMAEKSETTETPPPYSPAPPQPGQQNQQYVQQFMHQNPHGFVQQPQYPPGPVGGFSDISQGYGYNQPGISQMSTQSTVVVNQPQATPVLIVNQAPNSYMLPAVLACLFCCWPIGIGAIIAAANSQSHSDAMRYDEARQSANTARALTIASFVCGIIAYVLIVVLTTV